MLIADYGEKQALYASPFKRKDAELVVPDDGKTYVQALPDWLVPKWNGLTRQQRQGHKSSAPAFVNRDGWGYRTFDENGRYIQYAPLPEKWQKAIYNCLDWSTDYILPPGEVEYFYDENGGYTSPGGSRFPNSGSFAKCTDNSVAEIYVRARQKSTGFSDAVNVETGAWDAVMDINPGRQPYSWLVSPFAYSLLEVIQTSGTRLKIKTLDMRQEPPSPEWLYEHPQFLLWANEITMTKFGKGYIVSNFSYGEKAMKLHGRGIQGLGFPFMTPTGEAFIDKFACTPPLKPGSSYSVYNPPR